MKLTVIGAGTMGHGIAQVGAAAGLDTILFDVAEDQLETAIKAIHANLAKGIRKEKITPEEREATLSRIRTESDLPRAVEGADLVVEAVPESLPLKQELFQKLESLVGRDTVLATNTSSLPVGRVAEAVTHRNRVVGMHFFNPVHIMSLLEVIRAETTDERTLAIAQETGKAMGKECIVVRDVPGFATSRLGVVLGLEAIRMVEQDVATIEDIDKAMTLGYRHPVGPLKLTDMVGLDVRLAIAEHLHRALESEAYRPPALLTRMVNEGKLGRKSGEGFYRWD